ncbi:hypothetical protein FBUS_01009 [Fasciolopsis buskii]|uniref:Uncharacterized protein n=1 Tax=Fasciolopsis buskii TaxID=27845 RepID=A0A8E0VMX6_9TREM|nr:hypothetical protein FBUS_01009 [Fasciolopsis buski]
MCSWYNSLIHQDQFPPKVTYKRFLDHHSRLLRITHNDRRHLYFPSNLHKYNSDYSNGDDDDLDDDDDAIDDFIDLDGFDHVAGY